MFVGIIFCICSWNYEIERWQNNRQGSILDDKKAESVCAVHILYSDNTSSRSSIGINSMWEPLTRK